MYANHAFALYSKKRIVTYESLEAENNAPAPLNLPFGKLFFGYKTIPYTKPADSGGTESSSPSSSSQQAFSGSGTTLLGRSNGVPLSSASKGKGKGKEKESGSSKGKDVEDEKKWGKGERLNAPTSRRATADGPVGAGGARVPRLAERGTGPPKAQRERSPTPDWGVDDDDDVIYVDSD